MVGLMRDGGGFGAVVVTGEAKYPAVAGRAGGIAVTKHVAAAVDAGALAIPDANHAIVVGARRQVELLRAPDCGCSKVLVHAGLKFDIVLFKMLAGGEQFADHSRRAANRDSPRRIRRC